MKIVLLLVIYALSFTFQILFCISCNKSNEYDFESVQCILTSSKGNTFVGTTGGMYRFSEDFVTCEKIINKQTVSLTETSKGIIYYSNWEGLFQSKDDGKSWLNVDLPDNIGFHVNILQRNNNKELVIGTSNGVYRLNESELTWIPIGEIKFPVWYLYITASDVIFAYSLVKGIYKYEDNNSDWQYLGVGDVPLKDITYFNIDFQGNLFLSTDNNYIYRSMDGGKNWMQLKEGLEKVNIVTIGISTNNRIFMSTLHSIFYSDDSGNTWLKSKYQGNCFVTYFYSNDRGNVFAATFSNGLFVSNDNGITWTQIHDEF